MKTEGAPTASNGRICRGLRSEPFLKEGGRGGGYELAMDVKEKEVFP